MTLERTDGARERDGGGRTSVVRGLVLRSGIIKA